jgi:hypothetical protein
MSKVPSYGSVSDATETSYFTAKAGADQDDEEAVDRSFDADHAYYLKSESNLSFQQKIRKYGVAAVPIILAALMLGFFTLYLLRNLSILYPARGSEQVIKGEAGHTTTVSTVEFHGGDDQISPVKSAEHEKAFKTKDLDETSACSAHPNCVRLIGSCCPTTTGTMLDCCT